MGLRTRLTNRLGSWLHGLRPNSAWIIEAAWQSRLEAVYRAIQDRRFDQLEGLLLGAEGELFRIDPTPGGRVSKLNQLGDLFQELAGSNQHAERLYRKALNLSEESLSASDPAHALSLNNLGVFLLHQHKSAEAHEIFEKLLPLVKERYGEDHAELASCLENLAAVYRQTGLTDKASELRTWALSIRRRSRPGLT